jgi:hypothetical protein
MTIKTENEDKIDGLGKELEKALPVDFHGKVELNFKNGRYERTNIGYSLLRKEDGREQTKRI